jgi:hypothetical protein
MPYKGGVQLLPETQRRPTLASYASGNGYFWFGIAVGVIVIVASAIFSSYAANLQARIDELDGQLQANENSRDKAQEKVLLDAQKQSRSMRALLSSKLYWSQALDRMEQMARSSVALTSLNASAAKGTIAFRARADSYASVARQIKAFTEGTGVKDVTVQNIKTTPEGSVEFDGTLTIDVASMLRKTPQSSSR